MCTRRSLRLGLFCLLVSFWIFNKAQALSLSSAEHLLEVKTDNGSLQVELNKGKKTLFELSNLQFNYLTPSNWEIIESDATRIMLRAQIPAAAAFYKHASETRPLPLDLEISVIDGGFRFYTEPGWAEQITITHKNLGGAHFGVSEALHPDNRLSPNLNGASVAVEVNHDPARIAENYASAYSAFYMSTLGYAAFFDTFATGEYGFAVNGEHRIHHNTGSLDWYLLPGENGAKIHQAYFNIIGKPKYLPAWAIGPVGWRDQNDGGAAEILDDIDRLNKLEMPFTSWFVDRPYSDGAHAWSKMNFREDFAKPERWISKIRDEYKLEFMTWTATAFFGDRPFEKHLNGHFSYLDLSHPQSYEGFKTALIEKQHSVGVRGHKIDRADEHLPVYEPWHDESVTPLYRRNQYAYLFAKVHDEALRESWGDDQVVFARSAIHGTQQYLSAIWAGDPRTSWEGLQGNIANAIRSSYMGFPIWGTDVGGYQGEGFIPEDLYLRWMQAGSMTGLFEIKLDGAGGDGRDRMPWQYDAEFQAKFKAVLDDRMALLPYLYSLANNSAELGTLMQPMAYRHLSDNNTHELWDQFYVGDILVAPVLSAKNERKVYLPAGSWVDYDQPHKQFKGGRWHTLTAPIDELPRFLETNSLVVRGDVYRRNDQLWLKSSPELDIIAVPSLTTASKRFSYLLPADLKQASDQKHVELRMHSDRKSVELEIPALPQGGKVQLVLERAPKSVEQNGQAASYLYSEEKNLLILDFSANQDQHWKIHR